MRVRDDGAIYRTPRIDVEIAARAVESVVSQFENDSSIGYGPAIQWRHTYHPLPRMVSAGNRRNRVTRAPQAVPSHPRRLIREDRRAGRALRIHRGVKQ